MDPNQPSPVTAPVTPARAPELPRQPEKLLPAAHGGDSWGAFIGIVIIIIVLVVGALYFWGAQLEKQEALPNAGAEEANKQPSPSDFVEELGGFEEIAE